MDKAKKPRVQYSEHQLQRLQEEYRKGMGKGKGDEEKRIALAQEIDLSEIQVKFWVGNKQRAESGRTYQRKKSFKERPTAFTEFCSEYSKDHPGFNPAAWREAWSGVDEEGKERYRALAKEAENKPSGSIKSILHQIDIACKNLETLGIPTLFLGVVDGESEVIARGRGWGYFQQKGNPLVNDFLTYCSQGSTDSELHVPDSKTNHLQLGEMRKNVQAHLNELYAKASGKRKAFPYKRVRSGKVVVGGLPQEVLPLQPPSHYGEEKLQLLLAVNSITIEERSVGASVEEAEVHVAEVHAAEIPEVAPDIDLGVLEGLIVEANNISGEEHDIVESAVYVEPKVECTKKTKKKNIKDHPKKRKQNEELNKDQPSKSRKANKKKQDEEVNEDIEFQEFPIENLLKRRTKRGKVQYLVQWTGYEEQTWEPEENIPKNLITESGL